MSTKLTKVLSLMLAVLTLMCIVSTNDTAYAATAWPSVSRTAYMEFVAAGNINVYQNKGLTTRGTCSPSSAYNAYIETGDVCYVYEMTAAYIRVSYPVSSGRKEGYIKPSSILGSTSFVERITAKGQANTLKTRGGAYYGYTESGDSVYCVTKDSSYTQIIYSAKSGSRAFKLAWVTTTDYKYAIKGEGSNVIMTYTPSSYYKNSIYYSRLVNVKLTRNQRTDIVNVAASQLGYHEGNNNAGMSGTTSGTNNYTEYNYWYYNGSHNGGSAYPWCAVFVSWCARQAGIPTSIIKNSAVASCEKSYFNLTYYDGKTYTPKTGDLFFYKDWQHVGIVKSVSGSTFVTIEGNSSSEVTSRTLNKSDYYFGVPNYNK
ncbi:MAG: CHAP domain-containing protein [Clostridia bacterium]|nr:CHAP domain-containing protein [Clostridia bacterium]